MIERSIFLLSLVNLCGAAPVSRAVIPDLITPEFFKAADRNGDGKLDFDEYLHIDQQYVLARLKEFAMMDTDGTEQIDLSEFLASAGNVVSDKSKNDGKAKEEEEVFIIERNLPTNGVDEKATQTDGLVPFKVNPVATNIDDEDSLEADVLISSEDSMEDSESYEDDDDSDDSDEIDLDDSVEVFTMGEDPPKTRSMFGVLQEKIGGNKEIDTSVSAHDTISGVPIDKDAIFESFDDNDDGKIDEDELIPYIHDFMEYALTRSAHTIIQRYDEDKDGGLNKTELAKFESEKPDDLIDPLIGSEEYDYNHESDENDYGFAAEDLDPVFVSDH